MTVALEGMSPAQEQGWLVLLELFSNRRTDWTLIGGQMMYLLAVENGATMPRTTTDINVSNPLEPSGPSPPSCCNGASNSATSVLQEPAVASRSPQIPGPAAS